LDDIPKVTIAVSNIETTPDRSILLPVLIENNPGISSVSIRITIGEGLAWDYDPLAYGNDPLTWPFIAGNVLPVAGRPQNANLTAKSIILHFTDIMFPGDVNNDGVLVTLRLKSSDVLGDIPVSIVVDVIVNERGENVPFKPVDGIVTIAEIDYLKVIEDALAELLPDAGFYLTVSDDMIKGFPAGIYASDLIAASDGRIVEIRPASGTMLNSPDDASVILSTTLIGSGAVIVFVDGTELTVVIYGDVNGDGIVNIVDLQRLVQWLNGWDVTIDEAAGDVAFDGIVNIIDLQRLVQWLNGWDVILGPAPPSEPTMGIAGFSIDAVRTGVSLAAADVSLSAVDGASFAVDEEDSNESDDY